VGVEQANDNRLELIEMGAAILRIGAPAAFILAFVTFPVRDAVLISLVVEYVRMYAANQVMHLKHARAINDLSKAAVSSATKLNDTARIIIDLLESFGGRRVPQTIPHEEP
jgi:hypothetical protein